MVRLLACCLLGIFAASGKDTWSLVESASIRVISDDSPGVATQVLDDLAVTQSLLRQITAADPALPLRVFALKDQSSLRAFAPDRLKRGDIHTFGFSHTGPHAAFIALRTDRPASMTAETLRHEYAHVVTAALSPEAPAWLDEGLSEFWGALVVEGDHIVVGRPIARHLEVLRKRKWLPMSAMLQQRRGVLPSNADRVEMFYAQAWAMVHYLLLGQDTNALANYMPSTSTLPANFEAVVRQYVDNGRFRETAMAWQPQAQSPGRASTISEARALAERAHLLVFGEQPRSALAPAQQALALNPTEPLALEVIGTYHFLNNQPALAREWLTRALAAGPPSYGAAIYMSLLSSTSVDRERYLRAAIQARPDSDVAWRRLCEIFKADGRLGTAGLPLAETVRCRTPEHR